MQIFINNWKNCYKVCFYLKIYNLTYGVFCISSFVLLNQILFLFLFNENFTVILFLGLTMLSNKFISRLQIVLDLFYGLIVFFIIMTLISASVFTILIESLISYGTRSVQATQMLKIYSSFNIMIGIFYIFTALVSIPSCE